MNYLLNNSHEEVQKAISWLIKHRDSFRICGEEIDIMDGSGMLYVMDDFVSHYWVTPYYYKIDAVPEDFGADSNIRQTIWIGYDCDYEINFHWDGTGLPYEKFWSRWCYECTRRIRDFQRDQQLARVIVENDI